MSRVPRLALIAAALAAAAGISGCRRQVPQAEDLAQVREALPASHPRVVLVGLDGADWNVIRPLIEQGRLPTLARLVHGGASGNLRSILPAISPALWTSVMTGVSPERHGIHDFVYKKPGAYVQPIVESTIRERLALWNILSGLGLSVGVLDWYATWPAEPVNGFIVSDRLGDAGPALEGATYPPAAQLAQLLDPVNLPPPGSLPALERIRERLASLPPGLSKAIDEDVLRSRMAHALYGKYRPDLFAFYYKGIDAVSHFYWKFHDPDPQVYGKVEQQDVALLGPLIPLYYELCDELLGHFLERLDDRTVVIVISDHGFRAFGRPDSYIFDLDRLFSILGLLQFEDPAMAQRHNQRHYRMSATRIYTHEGTMIVAPFGEREVPVYLNVAGRDPEGVIDPARLSPERENIRDRLIALRTDLGTRVFTEVRIHDAPPGPARQQAPDLYLRCNREIAFDHEVLIDGRPYPIENFLWEYGEVSGTHREDGIFIAHGPGIQAGIDVGPASLLDVAPTMLFLLGVPVPEDFEGHVLRSMLLDPRSPALRVLSYETLIVRQRPDAPAAPIDEAYRDKLRALGYVQ